MITKMLLGILVLYRRLLSPDTGLLRALHYSSLFSIIPGGTHGCRFELTCSEFAEKELSSRPLPVALLSIVKRIGTCHGLQS
jgi:putative component of membrane protein insertase Oxa1/YidC/SpoIIIJ protein YidD